MMNNRPDEIDHLRKGCRTVPRFHQPAHQDQIDGFQTLTDPFEAVKVNQRSGNHRFGLDVRVSGKFSLPLPSEKGTPEKGFRTFT